MAGNKRLTVEEAAGLLKLSKEAVRLAIRQKRLKGKYEHRQYWVTEQAVKDYPRSRQAEAVKKGAE